MRQRFLVLLAAVVTGFAIQGADAPPAKPNFVLVLADDMGYGDIGPYGAKLNRTPNLDRLAREGMRLTSFYVQPVCTPSRAAATSASPPPRCPSAARS